MQRPDVFEHANFSKVRRRKLKGREHSAERKIYSTEPANDRHEIVKPQKHHEVQFGQIHSNLWTPNAPAAADSRAHVTFSKPSSPSKDNYRRDAKRDAEDDYQRSNETIFPHIRTPQAKSALGTVENETFSRDDKASEDGRWVGYGYDSPSGYEAGISPDLSQASLNTPLDNGYEDVQRRRVDTDTFRSPHHLRPASTTHSSAHDRARKDAGTTRSHSRGYEVREEADTSDGEVQSVSQSRGRRTSYSKSRERRKAAGAHTRYYFSKQDPDLPSSGHLDVYCAWERGQPDLDTGPWSEEMRPFKRIPYLSTPSGLSKNMEKAHDECDDIFASSSEVDVDALSRWATQL
eukprot:gene8188-9727_t